MVRVLCSKRAWGISLYELDSTVARVCTNKSRMYSIKQGWSRFKHDLHTIFIRFFNGSKYGLVRYGLLRLNTPFLRFTWHLHGLQTVLPTFVSVMHELSHIRGCSDINWLIFMTSISFCKRILIINYLIKSLFIIQSMLFQIKLSETTKSCVIKNYILNIYIICNKTEIHFFLLFIYKLYFNH